MVPVAGEQLVWLEARAAEEQIDVGELVGRAIERERRRIMGEPQLDSRTRRPGMTGSRGSVPAGFFSAADVAAQLPVEITTSHLRQWDGFGLVVPREAGKPGRPILYAVEQLPELLALGACWHLTTGALPIEQYEGVLEIVRAAELRSDRFIVVGSDLPAVLVTQQGIGPAVIERRGAVVLCVADMVLRYARSVPA